MTIATNKGVSEENGRVNLGVERAKVFARALQCHFMAMPTGSNGFVTTDCSLRAARAGSSTQQGWLSTCPACAIAVTADPQRRIRRQHALVPVAVRARRWLTTGRRCAYRPAFAWPRSARSCPVRKRAQDAGAHLGLHPGRNASSIPLAEQNTTRGGVAGRRWRHSPAPRTPRCDLKGIRRCASCPA